MTPRTPIQVISASYGVSSGRGNAYPQSILNLGQALIVLGVKSDWKSRGDVYPMDYYGKEGLGRVKAGECAKA